MENHLAIKEKEAQMHAATQMNYKCIVLMSDTKDYSRQMPVGLLGSALLL